MPESVTAELATLFDPDMPNDNGIAVLRYPGGPLAEVTCSFVCIAGENTTEIVAENGVVIHNFGDVPSTSVPRPEGAPGLKWFFRGDADWTLSGLPEVDKHGERIAALAWPLSEFLHGTRPPLATAEDGRNSLKIMAACYESSRTGRRVPLAS